MLLQNMLRKCRGSINNLFIAPCVNANGQGRHASHNSDLCTVCDAAHPSKCWQNNEWLMVLSDSLVVVFVIVIWWIALHGDCCRRLSATKMSVFNHELTVKAFSQLSLSLATRGALSVKHSPSEQLCGEHLFGQNFSSTCNLRYRTFPIVIRNPHCWIYSRITPAVTDHCCQVER